MASLGGLLGAWALRSASPWVVGMPSTALHPTSTTTPTGALGPCWGTWELAECTP